MQRPIKAAITIVVNVMLRAMNLDKFRKQIETFRRQVDAEAAAMKDSYLVLDRLHNMYRKFDAEERAMADQVLAEWALSEDENIRFDALALIDDCRIVGAIPTLKILERRLATSPAVSAPFELTKVGRIIRSLETKRA